MHVQIILCFQLVVQLLVTKLLGLPFVESFAESGFVLIVVDRCIFSRSKENLSRQQQHGQMTSTAHS